MQKIAMAVNPRAGNGLPVMLTKKLSASLTAKQISHKIFSDIWPVSFEGFTDVWIIGGDGTLNYFINHYPSIRLPLVIFKGGTGNDFAWKLYGNCSVEEQFDLVLKAEPKAIDAASCNNASCVRCVPSTAIAFVLSKALGVRRNRRINAQCISTLECQSKHP